MRGFTVYSALVVLLHKRGYGMRRATSRGLWTMMLTFLLIVMLVLSLACLVLPSSANATDFSDGSSYANEFMSGNPDDRGGWDENIYNESIGENAAGDSQTLVNNTSEFLNQLAVIIISFGIILSVARFAGRGVCQILVNRKEDQKDVPKFFLTGEERRGGTLNEHWVGEMIKETMILLGIAIFVGAILGVISGLAVFTTNAVIDEPINGGWNDFSIGGLDVTTTK